MKKLNENESLSVSMESNLGVAKMSNGEIAFIFRCNDSWHLVRKENGTEGSTSVVSRSSFYRIFCDYFDVAGVCAYLMLGGSIYDFNEEMIHYAEDYIVCAYSLSQQEENEFIIDKEIPAFPEETNNSTREVANELISNHYENKIYSCLREYHSHHGDILNKPVKTQKSNYLFGIELEVEFRCREERTTFTEIGSNWFYCERDGSLSETKGCEIVTIPLLPSDAKSTKFWSILTNKLIEFGARSWEKSSCGLHVHISKEILGTDKNTQSENLGKLLYLYHEYLKDSGINSTVFGRVCAYRDNAAKTNESSSVRILGNDVFKYKGIRDKVKNSLIHKSNETRYVDVNIQNLDNIGTIEFRRGKGSINANRIVSIIQWCEIMCLYSKKVKWTDISYNDFMEYVKSHIAINTPLGAKINNDL